TEVDELADLLRILLAVTARRRRRGFRLRLRLSRRLRLCRRLRLDRRLRLGRRRSGYAAGGRLFRHQTLSALPKGREHQTHHASWSRDTREIVRVSVIDPQEKNGSVVGQPTGQFTSAPPMCQ